MCRRHNPFLFVIFFLLVTQYGLPTAFAGHVEDSYVSSSSTTCASTSPDGSCDASTYLESNKNNPQNEAPINTTTTSTKNEDSNENRKEQPTGPVRNNEGDKENRKEEVSSTPSRNFETATCSDEKEECKFWAKKGECENNPKYMLKRCQKSCKVCQDTGSKTYSKTLLQVGKDMGVMQLGSKGKDKEHTQKIRDRIQQAREYLVEARKTVNPDLVELCKNKNKRCTEWAIEGECDIKESYMIRNCAPVCFACDKINMTARCEFDQEEAQLSNVWKEGDLNKMFERITSEPYLSRYSVDILSSPGTTSGPWLITLDDFLSEFEADRLIELGQKKGYKQSTAVGKVQADGSLERKTVKSRTSTNAWCQGNCQRDQVTKAVTERLTDVTGIPDANSEALQLLRYEVGQFYNTHHDYIADHVNRKAGVRVLTAYMYLNDVSEGGGTSFPLLNLTVTPKLGRLVMWPSVFDDKPNEKDERTKHSALKVIEGKKYGANAWFHQRDYKTPNKKGC